METKSDNPKSIVDDPFELGLGQWNDFHCLVKYIGIQDASIVLAVLQKGQISYW